jgi:hypothetical protein
METSNEYMEKKEDEYVNELEQFIQGLLICDKGKLIENNIDPLKFLINVNKKFFIATVVIIAQSWSKIPVDFINSVFDISKKEALAIYEIKKHEISVEVSNLINQSIRKIFGGEK